MRSSWPIDPPGARHVAVLTKLGLVLLLSAPTAMAAPSGTWEFRVCAQLGNYPASSQERAGYENRIAEILAEELGADLTVEWTPFDEESITLTLHAGTCDAVIGIGESIAGVLSTVPFLRAPYVFATRSSDAIRLSGLDDPRLAELRIGTYQTGIPTLALTNRGLRANLREYPPLPTPEGFDRDAAILDALMAGEIDVAVVYGPAAAARAERHPGVLSVAAVTPETDVGAAILQMFRIWTIGVRPHDVALRDRLNAALAARWDDVQAAIDDFGVLKLEVSRPPPTPALAPSSTRVGLVIPSWTLEYNPLTELGEAARRGAGLAENYISRLDDRDGVVFDVLLASAPNDAAAVRAAERLVATEDLTALIGGFNRNQAEALTSIAEEHEVVFFNIAASADRLREDGCSRAAFHIAASDRMYADAALTWFGGRGRTDWFLVYESGDQGEALAAAVRERISGSGNALRLVGESSVRPRQFVYGEQIRAIAEAEPDVVLLVLDADDESMFYAQFVGSGQTATLTAVPAMVAQTREYLYRLRQASPAVVPGPRPALWETSLAAGEAGQVNDRYTSRTGEPMEPTAWSAYAAILFLFQAASAGATSDAATLVAFLEDPSTSLTDVGKGDGVSFRAWDHQLRQPLYFVQIDGEAAWGNRLSPRVAFASSVGTVPEEAATADPRQALDVLGSGRQESTCRF